MSFPLNQPAQHYRSDTSHKVFNTPADAGYWSHANSLIEDTLDGTLLLIAPGDKTHKVGDPPPPLSDTATDATRSPPSHANPTRRPRQPRHLPAAGMADRRHLSLTPKPTAAPAGSPARGLAACQAEWTLIHLAREHHQDPPSRPPPA